MKVRELIRELQKFEAFDPELPVMVSGYEGGIEEMKSVEGINYTDNPHVTIDEGYEDGDSCYGRYVPSDSDKDRRAVYIPRVSFYAY